MSRARAVAVPVFTFALGVAAAVTSSSWAGKPVNTPKETRSASEAVVLPIEATELRVSPTGEATVRLLASGKNAFVGLLRMEPGAAVPTHRDLSEEIVHVLEGRATMVVDGVTHEVGPGTTILMPANAEVSLQNGDAPLVGLQVFAGPVTAAKYEAWKPVGAVNPAAPGAPTRGRPGR